MRIKKIAACVGVFVLVAVPCLGFPLKYLIETFDGPLEEASWRTGATDEIVAAGGNPGAFLHAPPVATDTPSIATKGFPGIWTGRYRDMGVIELGIDVELVSDTSPALDSPAPSEPMGDGIAPDDPANAATWDDRPVSLELINEGNNWGDPTDDCIVVQVGKKLPKTGAGWRPYSFHVPSYMTSLPSGWTVRASCGESSPDAVWNKVMDYVGEARFVLGDPDVPYPVEMWDVGFDNPRLQAGKNRGSGPTLTGVDSPR